MVQPRLGAAAPGPTPGRAGVVLAGARSAASSSPRRRISTAPSSSPRGWAKSDAAERELEAALALNPRFVAGLGQPRQPARAERRARARPPRLRAGAGARSGSAAGAVAPAGPDADRRSGRSADRRLRQAIARRGDSAADLADLGFGLGKALDSAGAYDEAFAAYVAANRASRASAGRRRARYDAPAHERFVDRLIAAFAAPLPADAGRRTRPGGSSSAACSAPARPWSSRSSPAIRASPPAARSTSCRRLPRATSRPSLAAWPALDAANRQQLRGAYARVVAARHPGAEVVTDKRPDNFLHIGLIRALFPTARIVHTRRDPIDNCLAVYFLHLAQAMPWALDLLDTAHWYRQHERLMAHWRSLRGERHPRSRLRPAGGRTAPGDRSSARALRAAMGRRLPRLPPGADDRQDAERLAGARAALHPLVGPLAPLRAPPRPLRAALGR